MVKNATSTGCGEPVKDLVGQYTVLTFTVSAIMLVFVCVRVVYKGVLSSVGLGADDWVMVVVMAIGIPSTVLNSKFTESGIGRDIWTLTLPQISQFGYILWINGMLYFASVALLKISILLFYLRIFPDQGFRITVWITIAFVALYGVAFVLVVALQCLPVSYNWTRFSDPAGGMCLNIGAAGQANSAISVALDIWLLVLPLYRIRSLNASRKKKLAIASMFAVGAFSTIVAIVRLAYFVQFKDSSNITYDFTAVLLWSTVEMATGVICACMPTSK